MFTLAVKVVKVVKVVAGLGVFVLLFGGCDRPRSEKARPVAEEDLSGKRRGSLVGTAALTKGATPTCSEVLRREPVHMDHLRTAQAIAQIVAVAADLKELTDAVGQVEVLVGGEYAEIVSELEEYAAEEMVKRALRLLFKAKLRAYEGSFRELQTLPANLNAAMEAGDEAEVARRAKAAADAIMRIQGTIEKLRKAVKTLDGDNEFLEDTRPLVRALRKDQAVFRAVRKACKSAAG